MSDAVRLISSAAAFAARRHAAQTWKDGRTPYLVHLADVADLLSQTSAADDAALIAAAWLHDVVEDGHATPEQLETEFGPDLRSLVCELTDDMSLPAQVRKQRQVDEIAGKSRRARLLKLADKVSNLGEVARALPPGWSADDRRAYAQWGRKVVDAGCRGLDAELERRFEQLASTLL